MRQFLLSIVLMSLMMSMSLPSFAAEQVVRFAMRQEPPNLNSMKTTDGTSAMVLGHVMEGLLRYGKDGKLLPGVAEKWTLNDQGATFTLRKDARWSDGKPVTAQDFVFAWRTTLDPKLAAEYAFILFPIKNAEAINKGEKLGTELGVTAPDVHTVKVVFEQPCAYFLGLTALFTYLPVREDFFNERKTKYAADASEMLFNGPFMLSKWVHGTSLEMKKNPAYWDAKRVKLDRVEVPYITADGQALFNFFKDGKIDLLDKLVRDDIPKAEAQGMKVRSFQDGAIMFLDLNFREGRATRNTHLRKAISLVINRDEFVKKIIGLPGTKPLYGLVPSWVQGLKGTYRKENPLPNAKANLVEARKEIEFAKKELGGALPALNWLCDDRPEKAAEAEYFQNLFKTALGIDLKIDKQIFKQRLAKSLAGDFDLISSNWIPDYGDAMTYADLRTTWNINNREKYSNAEHDRLIREAQATTDGKKRFAAIAKAEKILLDDVGMIPLYERTVVYLQSPKLDGVVRASLGPDPNFADAMVTPTVR